MGYKESLTFALKQGGLPWFCPFTQPCYILPLNCYHCIVSARGLTTLTSSAVNYPLCFKSLWERGIVCSSHHLSTPPNLQPDSQGDQNNQSSQVVVAATEHPILLHFIAALSLSGVCPCFTVAGNHRWSPGIVSGGRSPSGSSAAQWLSALEASREQSPPCHAPSHSHPPYNPCSAKKIDKLSGQKSFCSSIFFIILSQNHYWRHNLRFLRAQKLLIPIYQQR